MAGSFSDYAESKVLDHVLGGTTLTAPTPYLALFTADPGEATGGTEVSGGSYARVDISAKFSAASSGTKTSNADITFPTASADWGDIAYWAIFDASTSGNRFFHGSFAVTKHIYSGDIYKVLSGNLAISLD